MQAEVHIVQTGQSKTWKETFIEFKKYPEFSFWANDYEIWSFLLCQNNVFIGKNSSGNHLSGHQWYFLFALFWSTYKK